MFAVFIEVVVLPQPEHKGVKALGWKDVERTPQTGYGSAAVGDVRLLLAGAICSHCEVRAIRERVSPARQRFPQRISSRFCTTIHTIAFAYSDRRNKR